MKAAARAKGLTWKGDGGSHLHADHASLPKPQAGPQAQFLSSEADIVVYGGAAGGGKSFGLLLDAVRDINVPGFGFVIFRRDSPQITNQGGLWDTAQELYPDMGASPRRTDLSWVFRNGNRGRFAHLEYEDDKLKWQGAQVPYIGFDELSHFTESQFFYLLSRNRTMCGVKPRVRATTNPDPGWVKSFLAPWLDKSYPWPAESAEVRYFVRVNGEVHWLPPGESEHPQHGEGKSATFIRSTIYDNKVLLDKNPEYLLNLKSLPTVEQARLLHGDWDVFEGAFFTDWLEARHAPTDADIDVRPHWRYFGGYDWGYAKPFAFVLCATDEAGGVIVVDEEYMAGLENREQADRVRACITRNGQKPSDVMVAADPSMWAKKRVGEGIGKADVEDFWAAGLNFVQANNNRQHGWSRVREWLHAEIVRDDYAYPALQVFRRARNLIRTFPLAQYDKLRPEDMDTNGEDHALDALRYALMTRPRPSKGMDNVPEPGNYVKHVLKKQREEDESRSSFYA